MPKRAFPSPLPCGFASPFRAAIYTIRPGGSPARQRRNSPPKIAPNKPAKQVFRLTASYLRYAFSALLRRNIIAFKAAEPPYFPGNTIHRRLSRTVRERGTIMLAAIVRFFREWRRYNQSLRELSRLGDRELADIGISRSDIQRVAWNACHQR
jgi:uncharacterized protein YjiS (DUF1127 family)